MFKGLQMKITAQILLVLLIAIFFVPVCSSEMRVTVGKGFLSQEGNLYDRKQEAYIVAIADALINFADIYNGAIVSSDQSDTVKYSVNYLNDNIIINSETIVKNLLVTSNKISLGYNAQGVSQSIVIEDGRLVTPVKFTSFPKWDSNIKKFAGLIIKEVQWLQNQSGKNYCQVILHVDASTPKSNSSQQTDIKSFSFRYIKDTNGQYVYDKVTVTGVAFGGGNDSPDSVRQKALEQAMRDAVEQVNGVAIQSITEMKNTTLQRDDIITQTLGIAKVIEKSFTSKFNSEGSFGELPPNCVNPNNLTKYGNASIGFYSYAG